MKILFPVIFILFLSTSVYSQWTWQYPYPQGNSLNDICNPANNTIYIAGDRGAVIKSTNGGFNWIQQKCNSHVNLNSVYFINENKGWACGDSGIIVRTVNGGMNWITFNLGNNKRPLKILFSGENAGFVIADSAGTYIIFRSSDSGLNWSRIQASNFYELFGISQVCFLDENTGIFAGNTGLTRTTNAGVSWDYIEGICNANFNSIGFADNNTGYMTGNNVYWKSFDAGHTWTIDSNFIGNNVKFVKYGYGYSIYAPSEKIYKTSNYGITWSVSDLPLQYNFKSYSLKCKDTLYAISNSNIVKSSNGGQNWVCLNDEILSFNDIYFVNNNTGWAGGYDRNSNGVILKSTDSGNSWMKFYTGNQNYFIKLKFFNENTGYFLQNNGIFGKTTDGGVTFNQLSITGGNVLFHSMYFIDMNTGWAVGSYVSNIKLLYKTTNAGLNWVSQSNLYSLLDIMFVNPGTGWACGLNGRIIKTTNGGANWSICTNSFNSRFESIYFVNSNTGWTVSSDIGYILKTTDGGLNWSNQTPASSSGYYKIKFLNENTGYAAGLSLRKTTNGGVNWYILNIPTSNSLYSLYFLNNNTGWIAGENNILNTTTGGEVSVNLLSEVMPEKYFLSQNFPNPFNPVTKIKFDIAVDMRGAGNFVTLKVYDISGREIKTLVSEFLKPGTYEATFDGSGLPSGIYYCSMLIEGGFRQSVKMILLK